MRRGSATQKHAERVEWLTKNAIQAEGVPGLNDNVTEYGRCRLDDLANKMRSLGLFGATNREVQRETVRRLVSELRGERVTGGHW